MPVSAAESRRAQDQEQPAEWHRHRRLQPPISVARTAPAMPTEVGQTSPRGYLHLRPTTDGLRSHRPGESAARRRTRALTALGCGACAWKLATAHGDAGGVLADEPTQQLVDLRLLPA